MWRRKGEADQVKGKQQKQEDPVRVLLIEDNVGFAYYIRDALMRKHAGQFELAEARKLATGLKILKQGSIDVMLLDLGLPDSKRVETFSAAHAASPGTPIVVLTVLDDDEVGMQAMRGGAQDYLVKNQVNEILLVRSIRYAVERARIERALHRLSARLLQLQDEERRLIARELHDTTAQTLAALSMNLSLLNQRASQMDPETRNLLSQSVTFADKCSAELRTMSYLLHPPLLDELGLTGAVREYADGFAERSGIRVDLELPPNLRRLPKETETALFRVMQESLTNIHRHSGSRTASIMFTQENSEIRLDVKDAGGGIPRKRLTETPGVESGLGVGIVGMRERLRQLGGRLEIRSSPEGTTVTAVLPRGGEKC